MNEIILDLAALVLVLFCLTEYVRERRDPLPKGPGAMLRDRRGLYCGAQRARDLRRRLRRAGTGAAPRRARGPAARSGRFERRLPARPRPRLVL